MDGVLQSRIFQRFWAIAGSASIRVKVLGIVLGVIVLLGVFVIFQIRAVLTTTLRQGIEQQGIALSEAMIVHLGDLITVNDAVTVNSFLNAEMIHYSSNAHNTLVKYILITDRQGKIIAGTATGQADAFLSTVDHTSRLLQEGQILEIISPISSLYLRLGLGTENIQQMVNSVSLQLIAITLVMVAVGFGAAFFLTWILTRPLLDLVSATHGVAQGDFSRRVPRWANDEIGDLATAFNAMTVSLQQAEAERAEREQLREQYVSGVISAQEGERQRIARELHDSTSQSLTSLLVGLQNLKHTTRGDAIHRQIDELRTIISGALDEVRTISWRLRPTALDDLGLISALENYIADYQQRYQIQVDFIANGIDTRLADDLETAIYRMVQEGLTNIARYADSRTASVILTRRNNLLRIVIEDNGVGFDPELALQKEKSLGLHGIRERASLFSGKLTIESQPAQGTSLYIEIPYSGNDPS